MINMNKVILAGTVGKTPELKSFKDFTTCSVSVAVNNSYKDKDGNWVNAADWFYVDLYDKSAENFCSQVDKGDSVLFEAKLKPSTWEKDGVKQSSLKIRCYQWSKTGKAKLKKEEDDEYVNGRNVGSKDYADTADDDNDDLF